MPMFLAPIARVSALCVAIAALSASNRAEAQSTSKVTFFNGRMLTTEDLSREQEAFRTGRGGASTYGVVRGMAVAVEGGASSISISPGFAIAPNGEKVSLPNALRMDMPPADGKRYAVVCAMLRDLGRRCLILAVVERKDGRVRVERANP